MTVRTCLAPLLIVLLTAAVMPTARASQESNRPNVLFLAIDDLNDWIGVMDGHEQAKTPHLDAIVRNSVYFSNAHCTAPVCAASRNSLLSGLRPSTTGWYTNTGAIRRSYQTVLKDVAPLPQHFRRNGYLTLAGGKIYHKGVADFAQQELWDVVKPKYQWPEKFVQRGHGYGGMHFYPFPRDGGHIYQKYQKGVSGQSLCWGALQPQDIPRGTMPDEELADWAVAQLGKRYDKPFFLAVGFRRPHVPYTAPKRYFDLYDLDRLKMPLVPSDEMADIPSYGKAMALGTLPGGDHKNVLEVSPTYWKEMVRAYLACVSFVDDQAGKVLAALRNSPHADNTIVVVWSDHGQHLGEKKHWRKMCLWEESTRVPLAIHVPGATANGQHCSRTVSLLDLYPTLIQLCRLPKIDALEGDSLLPLLERPASRWDRPVVTTWHYRNHSVRSQRWRYIVYRDGSQELYDHQNDPGEHTNLAGQAEYAEVIARHRRWLPVKNVLPAGMQSWEGDSLDRRVEDFKRSGGPPDWLK